MPRKTQPVGRGNSFFCTYKVWNLNKCVLCFSKAESFRTLLMHHMWKNIWFQQGLHPEAMECIPFTHWISSIWLMLRQENVSFLHLECLGVLLMFVWSEVTHLFLNAKRTCLQTWVGESLSSSIYSFHLSAAFKRASSENMISAFLLRSKTRDASTPLMDAFIVF